MKLKNISIGGLVMLAMLAQLTSCTKQLEEVTPQTSISQGAVLKDSSAALTLYYGVYSSFRSFHSLLVQLGELRSDIWSGGLTLETPTDNVRRLSQHDVNPNAVPIGNWGNLYQLMDKVNTVIKLYPASPLSDFTKNRALAEMYGLRAYLYYTLLKTWGKVPLTTEPVTGASDLQALYRKRSTEAEVMTQIKSDIEESLTRFGSNNVFQAKRVFWNRAASLTLKGDVYSWSATLLNGGNADLQVAKQALEAVTNIPGLSLRPVYADVFDATKESNNTEIIFAMSFELNQATHSAYNDFLVNGTQASTLFLDATGTQTVAAGFPLIAGANRNGMAPDIFTYLTSSNDDLRIRRSFQTIYLRTGSNYNPAGVLLTKFIGRVNNNVRLFDNDFPIYRYAEVLLLLAEVKSKLGENPVTEINQIRQRAYSSNAPVFTNGSITENVEVVLDEYLREFIGEAKRWYALRRNGDDYVLNHINPIHLSAGTKYKFLLPITITMLNSDPLLEQTPGYN